MPFEAYLYREAPESETVRGMILSTFGSTLRSNGLNDDDAVQVMTSLLTVWASLCGHEEKDDITWLDQEEARKLWFKLHHKATGEKPDWTDDVYPWCLPLRMPDWVVTECFKIERDYTRVIADHYAQHLASQSAGGRDG